MVDAERLLSILGRVTSRLVILDGYVAGAVGFRNVGLRRRRGGPDALQATAARCAGTVRVPTSGTVVG